MLRTRDLPTTPRSLRRTALVVVALTTGTAAAGPPGAPRVVFTQVPVEGGLDLPAGSRIATFDPSRPGDGVTILTDGFSAAGRPDVSFDGRRILFVGRRSADEGLSVWEMNADGGAPRRIVSPATNVCEAIYLSTIYTITDTTPTDQIAFCAEDGRGVPSLYTCRLDGSHVARITFDPHGATDPCALGDGRLLFVGGPESALLTVNTDGTDVFVFAAAHEGPAARGMACETDNGQVVYVEGRDGDADRGGALVSVARASSLDTRRLVADDATGRFRSPAPFSAEALVVSYRAGARGSYGLCLLDPTTGTRTAELFDAPQWHELDARVLRARARPAGRSSVVDPRVPHGLLYCLDSYLSDSLRRPSDGDQRIDRLRVYGVLHDAAGGGAAIEPELLGTVPVEADGSFHLRVPVRAPLRLETLGPDGSVQQAMRSWFWVMPGERRGCIGCHEDRALTPPNRHPLALRKPPHPVGSADQARGGKK